MPAYTGIIHPGLSSRKRGVSGRRVRVQAVAEIPRIVSRLRRRRSGRCLPVEGEGDRNPCPGREQQSGLGLAEPAWTEGCLQGADGPGGIGTLEVFCDVRDSVAWNAESYPQGVKEIRGRGSRNEQVDMADVHSQAAQEAAGRLFGAVDEAGLDPPLDRVMLGASEPVWQLYG